MEEEVFYLSDTEKIVRTLGVKMNCQPSEVKILVNGKDMTKMLVVSEIKIVVEKKA